MCVYGAQPLASVQACPVGKHLVAISEAGNILIYDVATLGQDLHQVSQYCIALLESVFL